MARCSKLSCPQSQEGHPPKPVPCLWSAFPQLVASTSRDDASVPPPVGRAGKACFRREVIDQQSPGNGARTRGLDFTGSFLGRDEILSGRRTEGPAEPDAQALPLAWLLPPPAFTATAELTRDTPDHDIGRGHPQGDPPQAHGALCLPFVSHVEEATLGEFKSVGCVGLAVRCPAT